MPELPEVENVRASLEPVLSGQILAHVRLNRGDLRFPFPENFVARLTGRKITGVNRRAKYLLLDLDGDEVLIVHLGMTGRFLTSAGSLEHRPGPVPGSRGGVVGTYVYQTGGNALHDHVVFETQTGTRVTYNDPRRFGYMLLLPAQGIDNHPLFRHLGAEPLSNAFDETYLAARAAGRKADLKSFLMDQRNIAGLGNIYVCEALFRAGLSPRRCAATLADRRGHAASRAQRLVPAIREVLREAIVAGGSTLRDYRRPDGSTGAFQSAHAVYDREGSACVRPGCKGTIKRVVQGGRSTFYCPRCQT